MTIEACTATPEKPLIWLPLDYGNCNPKLFWLISFSQCSSESGSDIIEFTSFTHFNLIAKNAKWKATWGLRVFLKQYLQWISIAWLRDILNVAAQQNSCLGFPKGVKVRGRPNCYARDFGSSIRYKAYLLRGRISWRTSRRRPCFIVVVVVVDLLLIIHTRRIRIPREPFSRGAKYTGWENFAIFDRNRRLSRKRYEIGPWLL